MNFEQSQTRRGVLLGMADRISELSGGAEKLPTEGVVNILRREAVCYPEVEGVPFGPLVAEPPAYDPVILRGTALMCAAKVMSGNPGTTAQALSVAGDFERWLLTGEVTA